MSMSNGGAYAPQSYHGGQTAQSAITVAGKLGLIASIPFWIYVQWLILAPWLPDPSGQAPGWPAYLAWSGLAGIIGFVMAVALPASFALAAPSTAAGQYLQKSQVKTTGFWVMIATTLLFCGYAFTILYTTWEPRMRAQGYRDLAIVVQALFLCGIFIVLPASSWAMATPHQWRAQIDAWMAVERLKLAHYYELAMAQAQFAQALDVFVNRLFTATPQELQFSLNTFAKLIGGRNQAIEHATQLIGAVQGVPLGSHGDALAEVKAAVPEALRSLRRFIVDAQDAQLASGIAAGEREYQERSGKVAAPAQLAPQPTPVMAVQSVAAPAIAAPAAAVAAQPAGARAARDQRQYENDVRELWRCADAIGTEHYWRSAQIEPLLGLRRQAVYNRLARWQNEGWAVAVDSPDDHYAFVAARLPERLAQEGATP